MWTTEDSEVMRTLAHRLARESAALETRLRPLLTDLVAPQDFIEEFRLTLRFALNQKPRYRRPTGELAAAVNKWAAQYGLERQAEHRSPIIRPTLTRDEAVLIAAAADKMGTTPAEFLRMAAVGAARKLTG